VQEFSSSSPQATKQHIIIHYTLWQYRRQFKSVI